MKLMSWLAASAAFAFVIVFSLMQAGCEKDALPTLSAPASGDEVKDVLEGAYPNYCFTLNVPWIAQVPPGDWGHTKNCGQACGVMLGGYFNGGLVRSDIITAENQWLRNYTGNTSYLNSNGWYTGGSSMGAFREMLRQFHGLQTVVYYGNRADDVINEVARGRPTLVGVRINDGRLVSSGGRSHWALAVGWDGRVILHDPGTNSGRFIAYSVPTFEASWAAEGKIYMPVYR